MAVQRIQFRRGTAADWSAINPVLAPGEPAYEAPSTDYPLGRMKLGNGVLAWNDLPYYTSGSTGGSTGGGTGGTSGGPITASQITDATDFGRSVLKAADAAAGRTLLAQSWSNLAGIPAGVKALDGADVAAVRGQLGAVDTAYVATAVQNAYDDIVDNVLTGYVAAADLLPVRPYKPLTANYSVPKSSTTPTVTGVKRTNLVGGKMYRFRIELDYQMPSAADLKIKFSAPTGSVLRALAQGPLPASSNAGAWYGVDLNSTGDVANFGGYDATATATALGTGTTRMVVEGQITVGGSSATSTFELMAGQVTSQDLMGAILPGTTFDIVECEPAAAA